MNAKKQLLWSEDGRVGCTEKGHAPFPGSDTWRKDRWREMTTREQLDFSAEIGRPVECESCAADARNKAAS